VNSLNAAEMCKLFGLCGEPGIKVRVNYLIFDEILIFV
jgi:hypothetical protein